MICLADVVGHGIAPAMITAMLKILLLDAAEVHIDPADIVKMVNDRFSAVCLPEDFATAFLGVWMPKSRTLHYINAGHEPALLLSTNEGPLQLSSNGPLIGIDTSSCWEPQLRKILAGDLLVAWTDGIAEAWGTGSEQFGKARIFSIVEQHRSAQPRAVADAIERALIDHVSSANLSDDCTFVAIRFL